MKQKVFGIGFHKTGTSSLATALSILGYKVCGAQNKLSDALINKNFTPFIDLAKSFDAFEDDPWNILYKEMDKAFPNSKFILTYRDVDAWYKSCLNHFYDETTPIRDYIYGDGKPLNNELVFKKVYLKHIEDAKTYFKDRSNDFLIVDFSKGDGWEKLCAFLNEPVPSVDFPHANKGLYTKNPKGLKKQLWLMYKQIYKFLYHHIYKPYIRPLIKKS
jgi:hypothetical protein